MTANLSGRDLARLNRDGVTAMNAGQALELFDAALALDHPVVVAARLDRAALGTRALNGELPALFSDLARRPRRRLVEAIVDATGSRSALAQRLHALAPDDQHSLLT